MGAITRVFGEGFRVFFLAALVMALAAMAWWTGWLAIHWLGGMVAFEPYGVAPHEWHGHEMIFGYGGAALGGFLLTAVPNWTGSPAARRRFIALAALVWIAGRGAMLFSGVIPMALASAIDLAFLPILWVKVASLLIRRPKPQNVVFLVFLGLTWVADLAVQLGWAGLWEDGVQAGLRAGLLALAGMILVIGGRITPAFTRNAMNRDGIDEARFPRDLPGASPLMLLLAAALPLVTLLASGSTLAGLLLVAAGIAQLVRQARWGIGYAARRPILATLHGSMAMLAAGMIALGASQFTGLSEVGALHLLAIGGVGGMTLSVMSRATLGHSGRPLIAPAPLALAYGLMPLSALLRFAGSELMGAVYFPAVVGSGLVWLLAFGLALATLWTPLTAPRPARPPMSPPPSP